MFLIVFVLGTVNMYFLKNLENGISWKYYNIENSEINIVPYEGHLARKSAIIPNLSMTSGEAFCFDIR